jgi:hypothetical protein
MTNTTMQLTTNKDLSRINNLKDLQNEIARTKVVVKQHENHLKALAHRMPEEAMFAAVNGAIHVVVKKGVPSNIFNLVRNGIGLVMNIKRQKKGVQGLITQGKELILYTAINQLVKVYQQKRSRGRLTSEIKS